MTSHEATWAQLPDIDTGSVGQYYCSRCKLLLTIGYNRHYQESATGWHWEICEGDGGQIVESAGNKYATKYEPAIGVLDDVREEALRRFNALPCRRAN
jgi:hypothetical protein